MPPKAVIEEMLLISFQIFLQCNQASTEGHSTYSTAVFLKKSFETYRITTLVYLHHCHQADDDDDLEDNYESHLVGSTQE